MALLSLLSVAASPVPPSPPPGLACSPARAAVSSHHRMLPKFIRPNCQNYAHGYGFGGAGWVARNGNEGRDRDWSESRKPDRRQISYVPSARLEIVVMVVQIEEPATSHAPAGQPPGQRARAYNA